MAKPLKARDIMTEKVLTVTPETHVHEAIQILVKHGVTGLPVVDFQGHVRGLITEQELIHLLLEELITETQLVKNFMKTDVITCSSDDSVIKVCETFLSNPTVNLPVVEEGKIIGIISRIDILRLISQKRSSKKQ